MNPKSPNPTGATAGSIPLSEVEGSLERAHRFAQDQISALQQEHDTRVAERSRALDLKARELLPDLSEDAWQRTRTLFEQIDLATAHGLFTHKKTLGLFVNQAYKDAVEVGRTLLRARLDQGPRPGQLPLPADQMFQNFNTIIAQLDQRIREHQERQNKLEMLMEGVAKARAAGRTSVPRQAMPSASAMAAKRGQLSTHPAPNRPILTTRELTRGPRARPASPSTVSMASATSSGNDDYDLWWYYFTGIPMSGRTLLLDALDLPARHFDDAYAGQGGTFGGGGTSSFYGDSHVPTPADASFLSATPNVDPSADARQAGTAAGVLGATLAWNQAQAPNPDTSNAGAAYFNDGSNAPAGQGAEAPMWGQGIPGLDSNSLNTGANAPFDFSSPRAMDPLQMDTSASAPTLDTGTLPSFDDSLSQSVDTNNGSFS